MNRAMIGSLAIATVLVISGCSAEAPSSDMGKTPDTEPIVESPEPQPSASEDEESSEFGETPTSARGNLIKEVGQLAGTGIYEDPNTIGSRFVVTDIILDPECDSGWADPPANGHYLALHINVETTPELAQAEYPEVWFTPHDWQAYDQDGKRLNDPQGNAWSCMSDASTLPQQIGPAQSVSGYIVLDVAATSGTVVMTNGGGATGWEWDY